MKKTVLLALVFVLWSAHVSFAQQWQEHKSQHFVVYYKNAPLDFITTVETHAERYYQEITRDLGLLRVQSWSLDDRAQIYIYDDAQDFINSGEAAHWASGMAMARSKVIRSFPTAHGFFDSTLPHELGHIIFREFIGQDARIPLWFEEGVAMYQEKAKRWGSRDVVLRSITDGSFMPLRELSGFYPTQRTETKKVDLFYAEAASIMYYLIQEQGNSRFVRMCRKLQDDVLFEEALTSVYTRFRTIDDLNKAWLNYLH